METRAIPGTEGRATAREDGAVLVDGREVRLRVRADGYADCYVPGRRRVHVHLLVCEAWHGERPGEGFEAAHENGRRLDCRAENLRWKSRAENRADQKRHGTHLCGSRHPGARLSAQAAAEARLLLDQGTSLRGVAARLGVGKTTIERLKKGASYVEECESQKNLSFRGRPPYEDTVRCLHQHGVLDVPPPRPVPYFFHFFHSPRSYTDPRGSHHSTL